MSNDSKNTYDAIIIGAGIGGLVCGCYLAKAGMKVLIVEQHNKPGGYCTSFKRNGFIFDAAAHSFGSYREGGQFKKILEDLGVDERINVRRYNPFDIIITPNFRISFWSDVNETISNLISTFPEEENSIRNYFSYVMSLNQLDFIKLRTKTLDQVLRSFLKTVN